MAPGSATARKAAFILGDFIHPPVFYAEAKAAVFLPDEHTPHPYVAGVGVDEPLPRTPVTQHRSRA